jgi:hypothetical protein
MTQTVENLLVYFEKLSETEKHEVALEVVRRTDIFGSPDFSADEIDFAAEDLFLAFERGKGDSVKEINDYWGNADIDEIYHRVASWKANKA